MRVRVHARACVIGFCMGCMLLPGWSQRSTQGNLPNVSKGQSRRQTHNMTYMVHDIGEQGRNRSRVCVCARICVCVLCCARARVRAC